MSTPATDQSPPDDFETRLRALVVDAEGYASRAFESMMASNAHPNSNDYRHASRTAMMNAGRFAGLHEALVEFVDDEDEKTALEAQSQSTMKGWISSR